MKYQDGKIKKEHNIMKEFEKILNDISKISALKRIIPGRISRQQKGTANLYLSFSYFTTTGLKYNMKKGSTAQELFIICDDADKNNVKAEIDSTLRDLGVQGN